MTKVEEIEEAVSALPPEELAKFRAWFERFDAELWDEQIGRDAEAGKLNKLARQALEDFEAGRAKEI